MEYRHFLLFRYIWWSNLLSTLHVVHFLTPVLTRHLWQLKTVVFPHRYLKCAVLLDQIYYLRTFTNISKHCNYLQVIYRIHKHTLFTKVIKLPSYESLVWFIPSGLNEITSQCLLMFLSLSLNHCTIGGIITSLHHWRY